MKFIYEYDEKMPVSKKTLIDTHISFLGNRYHIAVILACIMLIAELLLILINEWFLVILFVVGDTILNIFLRKRAIFVGGKIMQSLIGKRCEFLDEDIIIGENKYEYSQITKVIQKQDLVVIRFGKKALPMVVTDENREQMKELLEYIRGV